MPFVKGQSGNPKGRKKGVPTRATAEAKAIFKKMLDGLAPEVEGWLRECAHGIEIEKTMPDGTTVGCSASSSGPPPISLTIRDVVTEPELPCRNVDPARSSPVLQVMRDGGAPPRSIQIEVVRVSSGGRDSVLLG